VERADPPSNLSLECFSQLVGSISSLLHPSVLQQTMEAIGITVARRTGAAYALTSLGSFLGQELGECINVLHRRAGWDSVIRKNGKQLLELEVPTCPFGSSVELFPHLCHLHRAAIGTLAATQSGYAKVHLEQGLGMPPQDCRIKIALKRSPQSDSDQGQEYTKDGSGTDSAASSPPRAFSFPAHVVLTPREWDILRLIGAGRSDREVASALKISVRTAENYAARIRDKLRVRKRVGIIQFAIRHHVTE